MLVEKSLADRWRGFLGLSPDRTAKPLRILTDRYGEESRHLARFTQHAERMQYRQFRDKLLAIAADEAKHVDRLAEKIKHLGGKLPDVRTIPDAEVLERIYEDGKRHREILHAMLMRSDPRSHLAA